MTKTVGMFPGLGADYPEMTGRYLREFPEDTGFVRRWELMLGIRFGDDTPSDENHRIIASQYRVHALNLLWWQRCGDSINPDVLCGHSMGFYSALVAAGSVRAVDSFKLIGTVFAKAFSVPGAGRYPVCVITAKQPFGDGELAGAALEVLSVNNAMQCVVHADSKTLQGYIESKGESLLSHVYMETGIPFHSNKLRPIESDLSDYIDKQIAVKAPKRPLVSHITGDPIESAEQVKWHLVCQPFLPVDWLNMVNRLIADGAGAFVEIGPNRILSQMLKWIDPNVSSRFVDTLRKKTAGTAKVGGAAC